MNCKNCSSSLIASDNYCSKCGAKIVAQRITVKRLFSDFANNVFGWDNKFFFTVRMLIIKPGILLKEYLEGTRKKYMNPLSLLALCAAIALFVFNYFAEAYLNLNIETNKQSVEMFANMTKAQYGEEFDIVAYKEDTLQGVTRSSAFVLKYFNLIVILMLPLYTILSFLTYKRPYNYGEHLVINSYIQSLSFLVTSIIFTISVFTHPSVYTLAIVLLVIYYTYSYGKLYELSAAEAILKLLKFIAILIVSAILLGILAFVSGYILGRFF